MPILTIPIESGGAIVELGFAVSGPRRAALQAANQAVPAPVIVRGLIDTGASCTCVDPSVIARLGLAPSGTIPILTPSTGGSPRICNQFDVAIGIIMDGGQIHVPSLIIPVIESDLSSQGIQALIGRDVLDQGLLIYDGRRKLLTVAY